MEDSLKKKRTYEGHSDVPRSEKTKETPRIGITVLSDEQGLTQAYWLYDKKPKETGEILELISRLTAKGSTRVFDVELNNGQTVSIGIIGLKSVNHSTPQLNECRWMYQLSRGWKVRKEAVSLTEILGGSQHSLQRVRKASGARKLLFISENDLDLLKYLLKHKPFYLHNPVHVIAHLFLHVTAIEILRLLQILLDDKYSIKAIQDALTNYNCYKVGDDAYFIPCKDEIIAKLDEKLGFGFTQNVISREEAIKMADWDNLPTIFGD